MNEGGRYALVALFLLAALAAKRKGEPVLGADDDFTAVGENYAKEKLG